MEGIRGGGESTRHGHGHIIIIIIMNVGVGGHELRDGRGPGFRVGHGHGHRGHRGRFHTGLPILEDRCDGSGQGCGKVGV